MNGTNELTLVFVPTALVGTNKHIDVPNIFYYISGGNIEEANNDVKKESCKRWIRRFQLGVIPFLNKCAYEDEDLSEFHETKSIWYSKNVFISQNSACKDGIVDYITDKKITTLEIHFAAHKSIEVYQHQLDLVFVFYKNIREGGVPTYFSFSYSDIANAFEKSRNKNNSALLDQQLTTYTDTGTPCPPKVCN